MLVGRGAEEYGSPFSQNIYGFLCLIIWIKEQKWWVTSCNKICYQTPMKTSFNPSGCCYLMTWMSEVTDVPRQMYQASALVWRFMCPWLAFTNKVSCPLPAPVSCNVVTVSSSVSSPGPECCICSQKDEESSGPFWLFCAVAAPKKDFSQDYIEWERWGELYTLKSKCWAGLCYWNFEGSCLLHQQICALYLDWC